MFLHGDLWQQSINRTRRRAPAAAPGAAPPVFMVADSNTIEPCTGQRFDFFTFPSISSGDVAFQGQTDRNNYRTLDGQLVCNARPGDPAPDGGTFVDLGMPLINFGTVAFWAQTTQHTGIYGRSGSKGPLMIVNNDTQIPGKGVKFSGFDTTPVAETQQYGFVGHGAGDYSGVFVASGTVVTRIADTGTPMPGGSGNFTYFESPAISSQGIAFFGSRSVSGRATDAGIYYAGSSPLTAVANLKTPAPDGGTFVGFGQPALADRLAAFHAKTSQGNDGIYAVTIGSRMDTVADLNTPVPGGVGTFKGFQSDPAAANGMVAFRAYSDIGAGLYLWNGSSLSKIIDVNDTIGGVGIVYFGFGTNDLSSGEISFYAVLKNNVMGIYRMPILE